MKKNNTPIKTVKYAQRKSYKQFQKAKQITKLEKSIFNDYYVKCQKLVRKKYFEHY